MGLELGEVGRHLTRSGLRHHLGGDPPDSLEVGQGACPQSRVELSRRQPGNDCRCGAEGLNPVGLSLLALEQESDASQHADRVLCHEHTLGRTPTKGTGTASSGANRILVSPAAIGAAMMGQ